MPTSLAPSRVPPNHAATKPSGVSAIVEACALAKGAVSKTNSTSTGSNVSTVVCAAMIAAANANMDLRIAENLLRLPLTDGHERARFGGILPAHCFGVFNKRTHDRCRK